LISKEITDAEHEYTIFILAYYGVYKKCTGEFGALAGDKSPSLPGTADFGKSTAHPD
jgi:hypothetical protein